jgi:hypothetical protein
VPRSNECDRARHNYRTPRAGRSRVFGQYGHGKATVTPFGAFPLIDYLIATSQSVGEGLTRLAHYLRLVDARSVPVLLEDDDAIRVLLDGPDTPFSAEFTVTINLRLCREETDGRFHAAYASFCHRARRRCRDRTGARLSDAHRSVLERMGAVARNVSASTPATRPRLGPTAPATG